jgi:cell pole-organizing protein PopZ
MAEETEKEEPSMDEILSSIRTILTDEDKSDSPQPGASETLAVNPDLETTIQPSAEMAATVANTTEPTLDAEPVDQPVDNEIQDNPETSFSANSDNTLPVDGTPNNVEEISSIGESDIGKGEDILQLTEQMIAQPAPNVGAGEAIVSPGVTVNSTDALQELAKALLNKRDIGIGNRDMTLEGLVRELLRPLLKEWMDQNLPYLIERLVKKEIDHMVNRAERLDL